MKGSVPVGRRNILADRRRLATSMAGVDLMAIMTLAAFLIGLAVVGLTLYASTLSRLREIGVMKAIGAPPRRLARTVLSQAGWTVGLAFALGWLATLGLGVLVARIGTTFPIVIEAGSLVRVAAGAMMLAAIGAVAPLIKVSRVDPATVFGRAA